MGSGPWLGRKDHLADQANGSRPVFMADGSPVSSIPLFGGFDHRQLMDVPYKRDIKKVQEPVYELVRYCAGVELRPFIVRGFSDEASRQGQVEDVLGEFESHLMRLTPEQQERYADIPEVQIGHLLVREPLVNQQI